MGVRRKYIRQIVNEVLDEHQILGAPVQVEVIAAAMGALVHRAEVEDNLSGFVFRQGPSGALIGVNSGHHKNRQRFTVAHELGHLLLHTGDQVRWDVRFRLNREELEDGAARDEEEIEANHFAAELLMPLRFLEQDLKEYRFEDFMDDEFEARVLEPLASRYEVSKQAMSIRLQSLGYMRM